MSVLLPVVLVVLLGFGRGAAVTRGRVRDLGRPVTAPARDRRRDLLARWAPHRQPDRAGRSDDGQPGWSRRRRRRREPGPSRDDLLTVVVAVSASLRAGVDPSRAWHEVIGVRPEAGRSPTERDVLGVLSRGDGARAAAHDPGLARSVAAVVAATRLALLLGAPLAAVLDRCARAVEAEEETAAELGAALAGPQQTAGLLGWLPAVGIVLGLLMGADPLAVLTDGGWGSAGGLVGVGLTVLGRLWVHRMVTTARAAGGLD
ncbi:MAG TPA: hypothetical protein VGC67_07930 [Cellulomonas sp.]